MSSLTNYRRQIETRLTAAIRHIEPAALRVPMEHVVQAGGKRLRPLLTVMSCAAAKGAWRDALDAGAAVELLHTFTLVHDDIMDNSALRRGRPTVHTKWDANVAILAGDTIAAVAMASLVKRDHPRAAQITRRFARAFVRVCEGQALDKQLERARAVAMPEYLQMIGLKTAAVFEMATALGGEIARGTPAQLSTLATFGWELGIAFQIRDDALDVGADPAKFGKDAGGDIREGKRGFLFVAARPLAKTAGERALLANYVTHQGLRGADVARLVEFYHHAGVMALAERAIARRTARALAALHTLPDTAERAQLSDMARTLTGRTY